MPVNDDLLLDFDSTTYATYDEGEARARLAAPHADCFRTQLVAARALAGFLERTAEYDESTGATATHSKEWTEGWQAAMRDVIAHMRQGDLSPGGGWFEDVVNGRI